MTYVGQISSTKRDTFKQCGYKYNLKYNLRIEEDKSNTEALRFGSFIHKIFEDGVKEITKEALHNIAESLKETYSIKKNKEKATQTCINNFLKFNATLSETIGIEHSFEIPLDGDVKLTGVIDRIIRGLQGGILIVDYKTSKREKSKVELFQDQQLMGYVFAASKLYSKPVTEITAAHYYPLTNNFVSIRYSTSQINSYLSNLKQDIWKIRKMKQSDFKTCRNEFCNWCGFKIYCSEFNDAQTIKKRLDEAKSP